MQIVENKAVLINVKNPDRITTVIPNSKKVSDNQVLVKWGLEEMQVLKNLNIKNVPSPILGRYSWPGMYKPFDHQRDTAAFLTLHRRAFCFNEAGCGKTGSVIWAADYLMQVKAIRRVLIICPLSIMDAAWRSDLFKFAMHRKVDIAHGSRDKRIAVLNSDAEFVIINYDGIPIVEDVIAKAGFDLIVTDEANAYKSVQTTRWKTLNRLLLPHTWLWMLTGTPAAQSPVDAFGLAKLVCPDRVPKFYSAFKDMVMQKVSTFRWVPKYGADRLVHSVLQPAIRYTKDECLDLPDILYTTREVPLSPQQKKYYEQLRKQLVIQASGEAITAANAAVGLNKLLQISSGAAYTDTGETLQFDVAPRYNVLREVIDESQHKLLIFVPFKHAIQLLHEKLTADGFTVGVIAGHVSAGARAELFRQFQSEPDPRILLIQPQAAAHGVTLTAADTIVWWGPVFSLETYLQANARAHRVGLRHPVTVVRLQGSPAEKQVYRALDNRHGENEKLVELYKQLLE